MFQQSKALMQRLFSLMAPVLSIVGCSFFFSVSGYAQQTFSKKEILHGKLTPERTCFDVVYQSIQVAVFPDKQSINVSNTMKCTMVESSAKLQFDLAANLQLDSVSVNGKRVQVQREWNTIWLNASEVLKKGSVITVFIAASGIPLKAKNAPWDGGFVWMFDDEAKPWVGLACEGNGASIWLPCKDHWSDEADSVDIRLLVPRGLVGVSNGKLIGERKADSAQTEFHWSVRSPINNYNISINIANYVRIDDIYTGGKSSAVPLTYYVLAKHQSEAQAHFKQTHQMLEAFEHFFGPYPFVQDGYKLVETPYWGMEHQSCVAYGNDYKNNKWGFDFIIVHESGHEWFGNSITAADPADMWIHESFTTYSEALFLEYTKGRQVAEKYLYEQLDQVKNKTPLVGPYGVHFHGRKDNDIYYKGTWMLHTLRNVINNDSLWFSTLRDFCITYRWKIIQTTDVIDFFNKRTGLTLDAFFDQYLYTPDLPVLEYKIDNKPDGRLVMSYRWKKAVRNFNMPIQLTVTKGKYETVTPLKRWQLIDLNYFDEADFRIKPNSFLIQTEKIKIDKKTINEEFK